MSRYRNTMSELLKQVRQFKNVNEQDEKDHEISMARGELEAIADKATQLASALQGKSDDGNPLEAWVQSKITKAKDYINSVSDYLMYNPDMKQNEETILEYTQQQIKQAYGILNDPRYKGGNFDGAVAAIEKLAKGLSKQKDVANALKRANEENSKELQKDRTDNYKDKNQKDLEEKFTVQITKKDGTTMELGRYNTAAEAQRFVDMYGKGAKVKKEEFELEEASLKDIFTANQEGQKADEIAKKLKMSVADVKKILGEESLDEKTYDDKEIDKFHTDLDKIVHKHFGHSSDEKKKEKMDEKVAASIIKDLQKAYADLKGKTISPEMANKISKHLDQPSYDLDTLRQLVKANIPFISTLARNKIYKKTGKFEDLKEEDGVEIAKIRAERDKEKESLQTKLEKEQDTDSLEKQLKAAQGQINVLKQKLENEKNKAIKPMPNPETGEVPLTIGIANKLLKDKEAKEKAAEADRKEKKSADMKDRVSKLKDKLKESVLNESDASDKAKSMGLTYMKFGRYGKGGKVTHKSIGGNLTAVDKDEKPIDEPKKSKDEPKSEPKSSDEPQKLKPQVDTFEAKKDLEKVVTDGAIEVESDDNGTMSMTKEYEPSQDYEAENDVKEIKKYLMSKGVDEKDIYVDIDGDEEEEYLQINVEVRPKTQKEEKTNFNEDRRLYIESISAIKKKADKSGMPYSILKKVYDRGMAAWKGGHRPGATQVQWALARVNSFVTKSSGTWGGADKDLAKKVRGK